MKNYMNFVLTTNACDMNYVDRPITISSINCYSKPNIPLLNYASNDHFLNARNIL